MMMLVQTHVMESSSVLSLDMICNHARELFLSVFTESISPSILQDNAEEFRQSGVDEAHHILL